MTVRQAAKHFGVSKSTIYRWIRKQPPKVSAHKKGRRWVISIGQVSESPKIEKPKPLPQPFEWPSYVYARSAEKEGWKPSDFKFNQWPLLEQSMGARIYTSGSSGRVRDYLHIYCFAHPDTPLDNQYDIVSEFKSGDQRGWKRLPDPVGMCMAKVRLSIFDYETNQELSTTTSLPTRLVAPDPETYKELFGDNTPTHPDSNLLVMGDTKRQSKLWHVLRPDSEIRIRFTATPLFYFLGKNGGMKGHFANMGERGHFRGEKIVSPIYRLRMDIDSNLSISLAE